MKKGGGGSRAPDRKGKEKRGTLRRLFLLVGLSLLLSIGAGYAQGFDYDSNGNGLPDHIDVMLGLVNADGSPYTPSAAHPQGDFDNDGVPDTLEDANKNGIVDIGETNPRLSDSDGDGIPDNAEWMGDVSFTGTVTTPTPADYDGDGIPNPLDIDSDNDKLLDGPFFLNGTDTLAFNHQNYDGAGGLDTLYTWEALVGGDVYNEDTDGDGLKDGEEVYLYNIIGASGFPVKSSITSDMDGDGLIDGVQDDDTDGDGISDAVEVANNTNPRSDDSDGDGLKDNEEWINALTGAPQDADGDGIPNPLDKDSDNDGLLDGQSYTYGTHTESEDSTTDLDNDGLPNFIDMDSDGDGLADGSEYHFFNTDPWGYTDGDDDGLVDESEITYRLNYNSTDTDGDGYVDSIEVFDATKSNVDSVDLPGGTDWAYRIIAAPNDQDGDGLYDARDLDTDGDGLSDSREHVLGTGWRDTDSDDDGLGDGFEDGNDLDLSDGDATDDYTDPLVYSSDADSIGDGDELLYGMNPLSDDSDGDGIPDNEEWVFGGSVHYDTDGDGLIDAVDWDSDNDGLPDQYEYAQWSNADTDSDGIPNWRDSDSDGDGILDGWEIGNDLDYSNDNWPGTVVRDTLSPNSVDSDNDGVADSIELVLGTNPLSDDSDGDGIADSVEIVGEDNSNGTDIVYKNGKIWGFSGTGAANDQDNDGLIDALDTDSDNDGVPDAEEFPAVAGETNWRNPDTDGDGLTDGWERNVDLNMWTAAKDTTDPQNTDTDGDGLTDYEEVVTYHLDPLSVNSDSDSVLAYDGNWYPIYEGPVGSEDYPTYDPAHNGVVPPANGQYYVEVPGHDHDGIGMDDPLDPIQTDWMWWLRDSDGDGLPDGYELRADTAYAFVSLEYISRSIPAEFTLHDYEVYQRNVDTIFVEPQQGSVVTFTVDTIKYIVYKQPLGPTDPRNPDTDGDGLWDGDELFPDRFDLDSVYNILNPYNGYYSSSPLLVDTDGDGYSDWVEITGNGHIHQRPDPPPDAEDSIYASNPRSIDTDGDGIEDGKSLVICYTDASGNHVTFIYNEDYSDAEMVPDGKPNLRDTDSDNDGISDFVEHVWAVRRGDNSTCAGWNPGYGDTDDDGISDYGEAVSGSDPGDGTVHWSGGTPDADHDGLVDNFEAATPGAAWGVYQTVNGDGDSDEDGISDGVEDLGGRFMMVTRPDMIDTDGDGLQDGTELGKISGIPGGPSVGTDLTIFNPDADPTTLTDPHLWDSDFDSRMATCGSDGQEDADHNGAVDAGETDPNDPDTDDDLYRDCYDPDPLNPQDTDYDGIADWIEDFFLGTDPYDMDTDEDGLADGFYDANYNGVYDAGEQAGEIGEISSVTYDPVNRQWVVTLSGNGSYPYSIYNKYTEPGIVLADPDADTTRNPGTDTDMDGLQDGTEMGLTAQMTDDGTGPTGADQTADNIFIPDADNTTTTDPFNRDSDNDWLVDGRQEDVSGVTNAWFGTAQTTGDGNRDATETDAADANTDMTLAGNDWIEDGWEYAYRTNPLNNDSDGDGLYDGHGATMPPTLNEFGETYTGAPPANLWTNPLMTDTDMDSLSDFVEATNAPLNPLDRDSDGDFLVDGYGEDIDPRNPGAATKYNGTFDAGESDATNKDTDGDHVDDGWKGWEINANPGDFKWFAGITLTDDGDALPNINDQNSDGDGYNDDVEEFTYHSIAIYEDSDLDGIPEGAGGELLTNNTDGTDGPDAMDRDADGDKLPDYSEDCGWDYTTSPPTDNTGTDQFNGTAQSYETDAYNPDTDGDGLNDGYEGWETAFYDLPASIEGYANSTYGYSGPDDNFPNALDVDADNDSIYDGDEENTYHTSPLTYDTDGDGRIEAEGADVDAGVFDAAGNYNELVTPSTNVTNVDPDGDGVVAALDVDSDNDWYLDGDGTLFGFAYPGYLGVGEDNGPTGTNANNGTIETADNETDPLTPNDIDQDGIPDWVEYSFFGTANGNDGVPAVRDADFDDDGMADGFTNTPVPTGYNFYGNNIIGEQSDNGPTWYTTDPRYADTDNDGVQDGTETGDVNTVPAPGVPNTFGTNAGFYVADADNTTTTDPFDRDSDNDGLTDGAEDPANVGAVDAGETDPNNSDTDNDAVVDGWDANLTGFADVDGDGNIGALDDDSDGDNLKDGLEFGFSTDNDPSTYTDPMWKDTDGDGLADGNEDANGDGKWDYSGNPYIWPGATGETNPLDKDTDHGGVADNTDAEPLIPRKYDGVNNGGNYVSEPHGDESFKLNPIPGLTDTFTINTNLDTLYIDPPPGDTGFAKFEIENNSSVNLDSVYVTVTDLVWYADLGYYTATKEDTIPADSILITGIDEGNLITSNPYFDVNVGNGLPAADRDTLILGVIIPWAQTPGYYEGRIVIWDNDPAYNNPIDTIVFVVEVDGKVDFDIANVDSIASDSLNGVGMSNEDSTGAYPNLMNLVVGLGSVDSGLFVVSIPNKYPDESPADGVNDNNGYPAGPFNLFDHSPLTHNDSLGGWDTLNLWNNNDFQGNMHANHLVYLYEPTNYPAGLDAATVRAAVTILGMDTIQLGSVETLKLYVDSHGLPVGTYEGVVYAWEDIDDNGVYNGPDFTISAGPYGPYTITGNTAGVSPDTVRIESTSVDAFVLVFQIMSPDLDIADDRGDIDGNTMVLYVTRGDTVAGYFEALNDTGAVGAGLWREPDGPGNEALANIGVFDPDSNRLYPFSGSAVQVRLYKEDDPTQWIIAEISGPDTLAKGQFSGTYPSDTQGVFTVLVWADSSTPAGKYVTMYNARNPFSHDPRDDFYGKILISGVGKYSNSAYDSSNPYTYQTLDYFNLEVYVVEDEGLDIVEDQIPSIWPPADTAAPGTTMFFVDAIEVQNIGNTQLTNIHFVVNSVSGPANFTGTFTFEPNAIGTLDPGASEFVNVYVNVPVSQLAGVYQAWVFAYDDDASAYDSVLVRFAVRDNPDIDIADYTGSLYGSVMRLLGRKGESTVGFFDVYNPNDEATNVDPYDGPSNVDLNDIEVSWSELIGAEDTIPHDSVNVVVSGTGAPLTALALGEGAHMRVTVNIDSTIREGTYTTWITVRDTHYDVADSFRLDVVVGEEEDLDIDDAASDVSGHAVNHGDQNVEVGYIVVVNADATHNPDVNDGFGNTDLNNIQFAVGPIVDTSGTYTFPQDNLYFNPYQINLANGDSDSVFIFVDVPLGQHAGTYTTLVRAFDDDGEPWDTITLSFTIRSSYDLDIADDLASLSANVMEISGYPNETVSGAFYIVNPNSDANNYDVDAFGNDSLRDIHYEVPNDLIEVSSFISLPKTAVSFSDNPSALELGEGAAVVVSVDIPNGQQYGTYEGWIHVFDVEGSDTVARDSFLLRVNVGPEEEFVLDTSQLRNVAFDNDSLTTIGLFHVINTGNAPLDNLQFEAQVLIDSASNSYTIAASNIYIQAENFDVPVPASDAVIDTLPVNESAAVVVLVKVPAGQHTGTYKGYLRVIDDDGSPYKALQLIVDVPPHFDFDIADDIGNLMANRMILGGDPGDTVNGSFYGVNPNSDETNVDPDTFGNADLNNIEWAVTPLLHINGLGTIDTANITISGPNALESGKGALYTYSVEIPESVASGTYLGRAYVFDTTTGLPVADSFDVMVLVGYSDSLETDPKLVTNTVDAGDSLVKIGTFNVLNTGNIALDNIEFVVWDLHNGEYVLNAENIRIAAGDTLNPVPFSEAVINQLEINDTVPVTVYAYLSSSQHDGTYDGRLMVMDDDGYPFDTVHITLTINARYDLDIADYMANVVANTMTLAGDTGETVNGSFYMVNPNNDANNVDPDMFGNADLNNLSVRVTNLTHVDYPSVLIPYDSVTVNLGGTTLESGEGRLADVTVHIPSDAVAGGYTGYVVVEDVTAGVSDSFTLRVIVGPAEAIDATPDLLTGTGGAGDTLISLGNLTVTNTGNIDLDDLRFEARNFMNGSYVIPADNIVIDGVPINNATIATLARGQSITLPVAVYVDAGQHAGTYLSDAMWVLDDDGYPVDMVQLQITITPNYDIDIAELEVYGGEAPGYADTMLFHVYNPNDEIHNYDPDLFGNADLTNIVYTPQDLLGDSGDVFDAANITVVGPTSLVSGEGGVATIVVNIPADQPHETYRGYVIVEDQTANVKDSILVVFTVNPDERMHVNPTTLADTATVTDTLVEFDPFWVINDGNVALYNLTFTITGLSSNDGYFISPNNVFIGVTDVMEPANNAAIDVIEIADSEQAKPYVFVDPGQHAGDYLGILRVMDDDGYPSATLSLMLHIDPSYDLDIADDMGNLVANTMLFAPVAQGETHYRSFWLVNPNSEATNVDPDQFGNDDLENIEYEVLATPTGEYTGAVFRGTIEFLDGDRVSPAPTALESGEGRLLTVKITVPADQEADFYEGMIRVRDTVAGVEDWFYIGIAVNPEEAIDIDSTVVHGTSADTIATLNAFTLTNIGNIGLGGIRFSMGVLREAGGEYYIPADAVLLTSTNFGAHVPVADASIDTLPVGANVVITPEVLVDPGQHAGTYTGRLNAFDDDGYPSDYVDLVVTVPARYDLDIADYMGNLVANMMVLSGDTSDALLGSFWLVNPNSDETNVDPDMFGNDDLTGLAYSVSDLLLGDESDTIPSSAVTVDLPTGLESGEGTLVTLSVNVPSDAASGEYLGWVYVYDSTVVDPVIDSFEVMVVVRSNEDLVIDTVEVSGAADIEGDTLVYLGVFNVRNNGNVKLDNIGFVAWDLRNGTYVIPAENIRLAVEGFAGPVPVSEAVIDTLAIGQSVDVAVYVLTDASQHEGTYTGKIMAIDDDGYPNDTVSVSYTINPRYDLDVAETEIEGGGMPGDEVTMLFHVYNPNNEQNNVDPDMFGNADLNNLVYEVSRLDATIGIDTFAGNITFDGPSSLISGEFGVVTVTVNIPSTQVSDVYVGTIVVRDAVGGVADTLTITVAVGQVEDVDIAEDSTYATAEVTDTVVELSTFHVWNPAPGSTTPDPDPAGNVDLDNLTFNTTGLVLYENGQPNYSYFIAPEHVLLAVTNLPMPANNTVIDYLALGDYVDVTPYVEVEPGQHAGRYMGMLRVIDDDGYPSDVIAVKVTINSAFDLDIADNLANLVANEMTLAGAQGETVNGSFYIVNPNSDETNVDPDAFGNDDLENLTAVVTDLVYQGKLSYTIPADSVEVDLGGATLASGEGRLAAVAVHILPDQVAGTYEGWVYVYDSTTVGVGATASVIDSFKLVVNVSRDEAIDIVEDVISGVGTAGDTLIELGTITIVNTGNVALDNLVFEASDIVSGAYIILGGNVRIDTTPVAAATIPYLAEGDSVELPVSVLVAAGQHAGNYTGTLTVKDDDGTPFDVVEINIGIMNAYDLDIAESELDLGTATVGMELTGQLTIWNPNSPETNVDPDPFGNTDLRGAYPVYNALNLKLAYKTSDGKFATIDSVILPAYITADTIRDTIRSGYGVTANVSVTLPVDTLLIAGRYEGYLKYHAIGANVEDSVLLVVEVAHYDSLDIVEHGIIDSVGHGQIATYTFHVANVGNTVLHDLEIYATDFVSGDHVIPASAVTFEPQTIGELDLFDTATVTAYVAVEPGQYTGDYMGDFRVVKGNAEDVVHVLVKVGPSYDLDIVEQNVDFGAGYVGDTLLATIRLVNPNSAEMNVDPDPFGNADLSGFDYTATDLVYEGGVTAMRAKLGALGLTPDMVEMVLQNVDSVIAAENVLVDLPTLLASGSGEDHVVKVALEPSAADRLILAGTYVGTVIVTTAEGAADTFGIEVEVLPEEAVDIVEDALTADVDHGATTTISFNVENIGNVDLDQVELHVADVPEGIEVTFTPPVVTDLTVGEINTVNAVVSVPLGFHAGDYTFEIYAVSGSAEDHVTVTLTVNPSYDLDIVESLVEVGAGYAGDELTATYRLVNPNSDATNVDPDPFGNADLTGFTVTVTDLSFEGGARLFRAALDDMRARLMAIGAKADEIDEILSQVDSIIPASAVDVDVPTTLASGEGEDQTIRVTLPSTRIVAGAYVGTVIVSTAEGAADTFAIRVQVLPEAELDILESSLTATVGHGAATSLTFTVKNVGNVDLVDIELGAADVPEGVSVEFEPPTIAGLRVDETVTVTANITTALGLLAGDYNFKLYVVKGPATDSTTVTLTVTPSYDLDISDNEGNLSGNVMSFAGAPTEAFEKLFVLVNPNSEETNVDPDAFGNAPLTGITATFLSDDIPTDAVTFENLPTTLESGASANVKVHMTVPTLPVGTYTGKVVVAAAEGVADTFDVVLTVEAAEGLRANPTAITLDAADGERVSATFYLVNTGNCTLGKIELLALYDFVAGSRIPTSNVVFEPSVIDSLPIDDSVEVTVSVAVPTGVISGTYTSELMAMEYDGKPSVRVPITVNVTSETPITFDDNPVLGDRTVIRFQVDAGYEPQITIMNMAGEIVLDKKLPAGTNAFEWLLTNEAGKEVASGVYLVIVRTKVNGVEKVIRKKLLILR